jgi:glycosyltransferase involved in cell wall biosynthesis
MSAMATRPAREPRVAIVADAMVGLGGGERVVEALAEAFPSAPVYTLLYDSERAPASVASRVVTSWLRVFPGASRYAKALLPLYPNAIESFDLSAFDVLVSSNHTLAKGILRSSDQTHVCYCHTPLRAIWERPHAELVRVPAFLRPLARKIFLDLRLWDLAAASRVDQFVANSSVTQQRIATHYRRESIVITPPIDVERFSPGGDVGDYYLVVSRNVPYKRIDLAAEAALALGRRLIVVGEGTEKLSCSSTLVTFKGKVPHAELLTLMRGARALLAPQIEDFGMAILEMNACGRPVIAFARGGALETLVEGKTGLFFHAQDAQALADAILRFETLRFDGAAIRRHAERFSKDRFVARMRELVLELHEAKESANARPGVHLVASQP